MNTRYASSLSLIVGGAFLVTASQTFATGTIAWLAFAIGVATVLVSGVTAAFGRHPLEHVIDGATYLLGAWAIVASLIFSGSLVLWLSFAEGAGIVALAIASQLVHEVRLSHLTRSTSTEVPTTRTGPVGVAA